MIVLRPFKYDGKLLQAGDEFIPVGGKWDERLSDPEGPYTKTVEVIPQKKKKAAPKKAKKKEYKCDHCERTFGTPQGLGAHSRVHK